MLLIEAWTSSVITNEIVCSWSSNNSWLGNSWLSQCFSSFSIIGTWTSICISSSFWRWGARLGWMECECLNLFFGRFIRPWTQVSIIIWIMSWVWSTFTPAHVGCLNVLPWWFTSVFAWTWVVSDWGWHFNSFRLDYSATNVFIERLDSCWLISSWCHIIAITWFPFW